MWEENDDFDDEEFQHEQERVDNLPIVKKSAELYELVNAIIETFEMKDRLDDDLPFNDELEGQEDEIDEVFEDAEELDEEDVKSFGEHYKSMMLEDVIMINSKLRHAESTYLYSIKMENAVFIKSHALSLLTATSGLKMMSLSNKNYLQLLRDGINEFRLLFVEWINSFDKTIDILDGWGLFFDPNIDYKNFDDEDTN